MYFFAFTVHLQAPESCSRKLLTEATSGTGKVTHSYFHTDAELPWSLGPLLLADNFRRFQSLHVHSICTVRLAAP